MKLRLQTDYALRTLIYLAGRDRRANAGEIADAFVISKDHLTKVIQQLTKLGLVRTFAGRGGGLALATTPDHISVRSVIEQLEGTVRVLECIESPETCPMEPGCSLRRLLIKGEAAFYAALDGVSIADLVKGRRQGGLTNLIPLGDSKP